MELTKDYEIQGRVLTVEVKRVPEKDDGSIFVWWYRILVRGHVIIENYYSWDTNKRPLTNQNVANHLATYWSFNPQIVEAQEFPESLEIRLNKVVLKCADLMHSYFAHEIQGDFKDYDVVTKFMNENEWHVVLSPNYTKNNYHVDFYKTDGSINVMILAKSHAFETDF